MRSQPIARVATVAASGQPDVVPLAFEFDGTCFWVGGVGPSVAGTRKFRNIQTWSWNLAGEPAGATWHEPLRTVHPAPARA